MKKIFLAALLAAGLTGASAQEPASSGSGNGSSSSKEEVLTKKGYKILPEAGDFALGIDAAPFLRYAGNFFNGNTTNNEPNFRAPALGIYGKYFLTNDRAVRARLSVNTGKSVYKGTVRDDFKALLPEYDGQYPTVVDVMERSATDVALFVGYEFRRGYRRLQGFYGGELGVEFRTGNKDTYTWANAMTEANQNPTSITNFPTPATASAAMGERNTLVNNGNRWGVSANAFVGVEYFVASKISLGGELQLGVRGYNVGQTETTTERWVADQGVVENTVRSRSGQSGELRLQALTTGSIFVMFHF